MKFFPRIYVFPKFFHFWQRDSKKVRNLQKKLPHECGGEQLNRKNFQNENSCHDMDVANCQKFTKKLKKTAVFERVFTLFKAAVPFVQSRLFKNFQFSVFNFQFSQFLVLL